MESKETQRKMPNPLGVLIRLGLPIALLAVGGVAYSILSIEPEKEKAPPGKTKGIRTKVEELKMHDYAVSIKTNGIVQSHNEVSVSAQVSGLVESVSSAFEVGAYFSQGEVLVEIDDRDYKTALAVAAAQKLGAESTLALAIETYERNRGLNEKRGVSDAVLAQSFAAKEQAAAQLETAKAQLEQAQRDLDRTKIVAPFDGRVRQKNVGIGQSVGAGTPLGVVFAVDYAEVRLPIESKELQYLDLPELGHDEPVDVELRDGLSADNENVWRAKIVRTEGTLDENSLELFAIARVDDPFGRKSGHPPLRIGQPVVASITGKTLNDVVAIPRIAVRQLDQIYLIDREDLTLTNCKIDPIWEDSEYLIVRDPLIPDGQWVAMTRIVYAPDGAKVEIIEDIDLSEIELTASAEASSKTTTKPVSN